MPIFEFECMNCGKIIELICPADTELARCPECSAPAPKIISPTNFHLKGSGWSKDNYSSKKPSALDRVPK